MSIRTDSYGSTSEVLAFTRHLLDAQTAFNSTTRPTATEVEKFIDRTSGALNTALAGEGITQPITNITARLICDDWVVARTVEYVELTQRGAGFNDAEGNRVAGFRSLYKSAAEFAKENRLGFSRLGVSIGSGMSDGLAFTAMDAQEQRADPDDTSLAQPMFRRGLFDNPEAVEADE